MIKKCVIMQPTYLPWLGYFNLISSADKFVFLDDVQFTHGWQSRNFILSKNGKTMLSVPILKNKTSSLIKNIKINKLNKWRKKHIQSITQCYSKHKYYSSLEDILGIIDDSNIENLIDLNTRLISKICKIIDIDFNPIFSSDLNIKKQRSLKLLSICKKLNCNSYLSPIGAKSYIEEDGVLDNSDIDLVLKEYFPIEYLQLNSNNFISHLSIIDTIANVGPMITKEHVINNLKSSLN